jgi:hypothetical protein
MAKIYRFDPKIYPLQLWIAINPSIKEVTRLLYFLNNNNEVVNIREEDLVGCGDNDARTFVVSSRLMGVRGCFINMLRIKSCDASVMAHEACHVADYFAQCLGFEPKTFENGEPYAYLVGWVVRCEEHVKKQSKMKRK